MKRLGNKIASNCFFIVTSVNEKNNSRNISYISELVHAIWCCVHVKLTSKSTFQRDSWRSRPIWPFIDKLLKQTIHSTGDQSCTALLPFVMSQEASTSCATYSNRQIGLTHCLFTLNRRAASRSRAATRSTADAGNAGRKRSNKKSAATDINSAILTKSALKTIILVATRIMRGRISDLKMWILRQQLDPLINPR